MHNQSEINDSLASVCAAEGLRFCGVAALGPEESFPRFVRWLDDGQHASMRYLAENLALREDPRGLLAGARTALVVGLPYYLGDKAPVRGAPRVAQYARLQDYHKVLWRRGEAILEKVIALHGTPGKDVGRVVVDSAPILERALAARSGGGFIGKNTCFIDPRHGSFFLLAEILTTLTLPTGEREPVDPAVRGERGGCGSCKRCQVHCPTGALAEDYVLDARRCLAYWTIEHRGTIPEEFWPWMKLYWFGCDICQLVCPYNRKAEVQADARLVKFSEPPPLFDVATMTQATYEKLFGGTPMTRAKRPGLMRNALIAMTVTRDPRLEEAIIAAAQAGEQVLDDTIAQVRSYRVSS